MKGELLVWVSLSIVAVNLYLLGTGRLTAMIRGVALQGILLSALPVLLPYSPGGIHVLLLVLISIGIKGVAIPGYLFRSLRGVTVAHDTNAAVGPTLSVIVGVVVSAAAFCLLRNSDLSSIVASPFHAANAVATACIGLFLIVTRRSVVGQVIGYLVFENSAFMLGISIAAFQPLLIELGVLLDMLVAVFIMVVAVHSIHAEHDTISIASLERLVR